MSVSATAKVLYEAATVITDKDKRNALFMVLAIPIVVVIIVSTAASSLFFKSNDPSDIYSQSVTETEKTNNTTNSIDGDLIRSIFMLHTGRVSTDKNEISKFILDYFHSPATNAFYSFDEILLRTAQAPFNFGQAELDILAYFKPYKELVLDDNFVAPCSGTIMELFGERINPVTFKQEFHNAIDIQGVWHQPILSVADGTVVKVSTIGSYGNHITIEHNVSGQHFFSLYAHMSQILVKVGQTVTKGETIGKEGGAKSDNNPGTSTGHHLHFEIRETIDGGHLNPQNIFEMEGN